MHRFFKNFAIGTLVAVVTLVGMMAIPDSPYLRWQSVKTEAFARLGWIYERIHYDKTPIDIAFIGTSHTLMGVDTPMIENKIAEAGIRTQDGEYVHLVNFAIPSYGRDLHWLIARELLENRQVKVLVLEVFENETRKAHPLFVHVANREDILKAPMLININYVHNLIRLPWRQLSLAFKSIDPPTFGLKTAFDINDYDGSDVDNTQVVNVGGKALSPLRDAVMPREELEASGKYQKDAKNLHMLGVWAQKYEYAVPDFYVSSILELAREKGTDVIFLYLPQFGMPPQPVDQTLYKNQGDWFYANDIVAVPDYWFDQAHLNSQGALKLSARLADEFLSRWQTKPTAMEKEGLFKDPNQKTVKNNAIAARSVLVPFKPTNNSAGQSENDQ